VDFEKLTGEAKDWFAKIYPDVRQMPQIFINNQRVGGLAGLQAALKELGL
jgi:glutaredoxin 3